MSTKSRAAKGGQFGANGEWYEGGKFINTVPENAKGQAKKVKKSGKQEWENYKWAVAPEEGQRSLFRMLAGTEIYNHNNDAPAFSFNPNLRGDLATPEHIATREARIEAFNNGVRWI